ncbi:MAG: PGPGW domain-containing protein [Planctomycetota bacterium]|nr:PGPGW domain-containing protein [Planctomycetota bacterium]
MPGRRRRLRQGSLARRIWVLAAGITIVVVGILISPLPGPGFTILGPAGLALIATEFIWARRLLRDIKRRSRVVTRRTDSLAQRTSRWWVPPVVVGYWCGVVALAEFSPIPRFLVWAVSFPIFMPVALWAWATLRYRASLNAPAVEPRPGKGARVAVGPEETSGAQELPGGNGSAEGRVS